MPTLNRIFPDLSQGFLINRTNEGSRFLFKYLLETIEQLAKTDDQVKINELKQNFDNAYIHVIGSIPEYPMLDRAMYDKVFNLVGTIPAVPIAPATVTTTPPLPSPLDTSLQNLVVLTVDSPIFPTTTETANTTREQQTPPIATIGGANEKPKDKPPK